MDELHGKHDPLGFVCSYHPTLLNSAKDYVKAGADFERWKMEPFLALVPYLQVQRAFGWGPFRRTFAEYLYLPDEQRPQDDSEKREQWVRRLSVASGQNLVSFW